MMGWLNLGGRVGTEGVGTKRGMAFGVLPCLWQEAEIYTRLVLLHGSPGTCVIERVPSRVQARLEPVNVASMSRHFLFRLGVHKGVSLYRSFVTGLMTESSTNRLANRSYVPFPI
jgi:hypothetical protein